MAWLCRVIPLLLEQTYFSDLFAWQRQFSSMFWSEQNLGVKSYFPCYRTRESACSTIPDCYWSYQLQQCSDDMTLPEKLVLNSFRISLSYVLNLLCIIAKRTWNLRTKEDVKDISLRGNFKRYSHKIYMIWNV